MAMNQSDHAKDCNMVVESLVEPRLNFCLHLHLGSFCVFVFFCFISSMDVHDMHVYVQGSPGLVWCSACMFRTF